MVDNWQLQLAAQNGRTWKEQLRYDIPISWTDFGSHMTLRQWQRAWFRVFRVRLAFLFVDMSLSNAVDNAQAKLLSIPATPARDRDRHPFPSSQSPLRQLTSSSTSSNLAPSSSSSVQISPQAMSVDALLKQHAAAPDPRTAAFEHVVNDRNVLSSQNAQLWKLIEKQRAGYNQILKELERIRGERDGYKSKLIALGALPNGSERRQKPSIDRAIRPSLDLPTDSPSAASPSQSQSQRFLVQRHNSDDTGNFTTSRHLLTTTKIDLDRPYPSQRFIPPCTPPFSVTGSALGSFCRH